MEQTVHEPGNNPQLRVENLFGISLVLRQFISFKLDQHWFSQVFTLESPTHTHHLSMLLQPAEREQEPSAELHSRAVPELCDTLWQPFPDSSFSIKFMGGS